jgi:ATP-dependent exoDNAse (exonuclease V) alpha subunit
MITVNSPDGSYVNGTRGVVHKVEVNEATGLPSVVTVDVDGTHLSFRPAPYRMTEHANIPGIEDEIISVTDEYGAMQRVPRYPVAYQFPLLPACSVTAHKAQGLSLDQCHIDMSQAFAPGHVYVALSRLRTPEGLSLQTAEMKVIVDPEVIEYYRDIFSNLPPSRDITDELLAERENAFSSGGARVDQTRDD